MEDLQQPLASSQTFRSFLYFWVGQLFSLLGSSIVMFAITWWITVETQSATILSLFVFLSFAPVIFIAPIAGVYVDRWNRKVIILVSDFLQALLTLGLILIFFIGTVEIWHILVLNTLRAFCQAFHMPTISAITPIMVPKERLSQINGVGFFFFGLINIIGPVVGASLLVIFSLEQILWVDVITFIIAVIPLLFIKIPSIVKKLDQQELQKENSFIIEFKEGLLTIKEIKGMLSFLLTATVLIFLFSPLNALLPYFINVYHSGNASNFAQTVAFFQIGLMIGSIISFAKKQWKKKINGIIGFIYIQIVGVIILILAPRGNFLMLGIGMFIIGVCEPIFQTLLMTIFQTSVHLEKQGRIMSIVMTITHVAAPFGILISGPIADMIGIIPLLFFSIILGITTFTFSIIFTDIRKIEDIRTVKSTPEEEET